MTDKLIVQCIVKCENSYQECWLDAEKIKVGDSVTLKNSDDPTKWWEIIEMGFPIAASLIHSEHDSKAIHEKDFHGRFKGIG